MSKADSFLLVSISVAVTIPTLLLAFIDDVRRWNEYILSAVRKKFIAWYNMRDW